MSVLWYEDMEDSASTYSMAWSFMCGMVRGALYPIYGAVVRKPISLRSNEDDMVVVMEGDMGADGRREA